MLLRSLQVEATHAAPISAIEAWCCGVFDFPLIMSAMFIAQARPMSPDGMPVRGGAGEITVPLGALRGVEIGCGGAKAMPTPNTFGYDGLT